MASFKLHSQAVAPCQYAEAFTPLERCSGYSGGSNRSRIMFSWIIFYHDTFQ